MLSATRLASGATASFAPKTISPGSTATSIGLTVQTVKQASSLGVVADSRGQLAVLMALMVPLPWAMRRRKSRLGLISSLLLLIFVVGCGGGTSSSSSPTTPPTSTPQTYIVTVTATSGLLSHSVPLTLIVQ